tara:strand:+ start:313 stop:480 length:168 start_codon:yes stop_codon:yes gene_type:complete
MKETKYETLPSNYTIVDLEGYSIKDMALTVARAMTQIAKAKNKTGVFYTVLSEAK